MTQPPVPSQKGAGGAIFGPRENHRSMILKSGNRFSDKIMLQGDRPETGTRTPWPIH